MNSKLKLTFVSASPVLVNEIRRFYQDFKKHFSIELEKAQAKRIKNSKSSDNTAMQHEENKENL